MKVLITGFPGTGKTTIAQALKAHGRNAYDPQAMRTYMHIENTEGKHIQQPKPVPKGWFNTIGFYNWDPIKIDKLLNSQDDLYICSLAHNQSDFYNQFDRIFVLTLDDSKLKSRLNDRKWSGGLGADETEMQDILIHKKHFEKSLLEHGAIPIDTELSIEQTIGEIQNRLN